MARDPFRRFARRRADYEATFASEAGRRVLADLYRFCHMDQPSFAVDPCITAFNEGRRRVFLRILGILRLTDADIIRLAKETERD
jgi:hypothetical protein